MLATSLLLLYVGGSLALPGNKVVRQLLSTPSVIPQACQQDTHAPDPECYDLLQVGDFITQFQQTCDPAVETPGQRCPCVESQGWSSCLIETAQLTAFNGVTPHGPNGPYNYSCFNLANASEPCLVPDFQQPLTAYTERFNLAVSSIECTYYTPHPSYPPVISLQSEVSLLLISMLDYRPSLLFLLVSIFQPPKPP